MFVKSKNIQKMMIRLSHEFSPFLFALGLLCKPFFISAAVFPEFEESKFFQITAPKITDPSIQTLAQPFRIIAADFNRDGAEDFAVTTTGINSTNSITTQPSKIATPAQLIFFKNDPANPGTFTEDPIRHSLEAGWNDLAVGDFKREGFREDIAILINNSKKISVYLNDGNGTFHEKNQNLTADNGACAIAAGFLKADGLGLASGLVVANSSASTVSIFILDENGDFIQQPSLSTQFPPTNITLADLNQDGLDDLIVTHSNDDCISVYFNKGDGTFALPPQVYEVGDFPTAVVAADFNNNGFNDLAITNGGASGEVVNNPNKNSVTIRLNTPDPMDSTKRVFTIIGQTIPLNSSATANNGNFPVDLATANFDGGSPSIVTANEASATTGILTNRTTSSNINLVLEENLPANNTPFSIAIATGLLPSTERNRFSIGVVNYNQSGITILNTDQSSFTPLGLTYKNNNKSSSSNHKKIIAALKKQGKALRYLKLN